MSFRGILLFVLAVLVFVSSVLADAPNRMNFQGRLTDPAGNPLTGVYSIRFSIWTASVAGTEKWNETQGAVSVSNGLFNVELGLSNEIDDSVLFQTQDRYLEIKVGADLPLTPRQKLMSAPFAFSLENEPGLAEGNLKSTSDITLTTTAANILSRIITTQTDGWVIVTASGYFEIDPDASTNAQFARATISTTSATLDFDNLAIFGAPDWPSASAQYFCPFSITRVFAVTAGSATYYLVAAKFTAADVVDINRPSLTLLFVPESKGLITGLAAQGSVEMNTGSSVSGPDRGPSVPADVPAKSHVPEGEER